MDITKGLFRVRTAIQVLIDASQQAEPRKLYKTLIYEGELTIIFADTNVGKSILAVQIANDISQTDKVLYIDLEMSDKQFERRYSEEFSNHYQFNDNFIRADFSKYRELSGKKYEELFAESIVEICHEYDIKIVIIDNLGMLTLEDTDSAKNAKPLMNRLNDLKREHGLTLVVMDHTRKANKTKAISLDELNGSKAKASFADASFAIGKSQKDSKLRYVKQMKIRSGESEYESDNILVYEIAKETNFLEFKYIGQDKEYNHVRVYDQSQTEELISKVAALYEKGNSKRSIAKDLGISESYVRKILKEKAKKESENGMPT